jgi:outer membrane protein TolC
MGYAMNVDSKKLFSPTLKKLKRALRIPRRNVLVLSLPLFLLVLQTGCQTPAGYRKEADKVAQNIIEKKQEQAFGKTEAFEVERPSDLLRRRLLIEQNLPYAGGASLGMDELKKIDHWPEKDFPAAVPASYREIPLEPGRPLQLSLLQALEVGARNSSEYQSFKEEVFREALNLDLEQNQFRDIYQAQLDGLIQTDLGGAETVTGAQGGGLFSWSRTLKSGAQLGAALAVDLVKLLTQDHDSSLGIVGDATIAIPLMRGSGSYIVAEPLTQAERNVLYALYEFERFRKTFAVDIGSSYLGVLNQAVEVENEAENYRNLISSTRRSRRLADAGRATEVEVDQSVQNELRARNRWISVRELLETRLDAFKKLIGLPPDAQITLDKADLDRLVNMTSELIEDIARKEELKRSKSVPPADAPIQLVEPGRENAGPLEMNSTKAVELGLENRLDLRVAQGRVFDAQRKVIVAADALRAELTLLGNARIGEPRSVDSVGLDNAAFRADKGFYSALLTIDLPIERTAERDAYRNSYITLERTVRDVQNLEDDIKLSIRNSLRLMAESRETREIQANAVYVAQNRVKSTSLFFEAGRIQIRDLLDAQESLVQAQNLLTAAVVAYRVAELNFQSDTGLLKIDEKGLWQEYNPEDSNNVKQP